MQLSNKQRSNIEELASRVHACGKTFTRIVSEESWPIAADIPAGLAERVERLRIAVADFLTKPADAEIDGGALAEAVTSLRRFLPEVKKANQIAAGDYMTQNGEQNAEKADELEHTLSNQPVYISGYLFHIEKALRSQADRMHGTGLDSGPGSGIR